MVYYSQLVGKFIIDSNKNKIGVVKDFCFVDGPKFLTITGILLKNGDELKVISWNYVSEVGDKDDDNFPFSIYLSKKIEKIKYVASEDNLLSELIDKQIIDVSGVRIVRVNDILLGKVGHKFAAIGVSVSTHGLLRRLGFSRFIKEKDEKIIMMKDVAPLPKKIDNLQLKIHHDKLNQMHPAELADLIRDLSLEEKLMIFRTLSRETAAKALARAHPDVKKKVFNTLSVKQLAEMLELMPTLDAVSMLNLMPTVNNAKVLKMMKPGIAAKIRKLLKYEKRTAGSVMSTRFIRVPGYYTVRKTISLIRHEMPLNRNIIYLYVTDKDGVLEGVISLRDLVLSRQGERVSNIARKEMMTVSTKTDIDEVFSLMSKYELLTLPVVDKDKRIVGVIRVHNMFSLTLPERIRRLRILRQTEH